MTDLSISTNSVRKMAIGWGAVSLISLSSTPYYAPDPHSDRYTYIYEYTSENHCFYQLKHEMMQHSLTETETEGVMEVQVVKTIKVNFNKPKRLEFHSVEDVDGFLS